MSSNTTLNKKVEVMGKRQTRLNKIKVKSPGSFPKRIRLSHGSKYCIKTMTIKINTSHLIILNFPDVDSMKNNFLT
jgi:hypothetical protein